MIEYDAVMDRYHVTHIDKWGGWHECWKDTYEEAEQWLETRKRRDNR